jgi:hypothetical protein
MNLENEIASVSGCAHNFSLEDAESDRNDEEMEPCLRKSDAIRIANQYAEEMCKKQREICSNAAFVTRQKELVIMLPDAQIATMNRIIDRIKTAPLAIEAKQLNKKLETASWCCRDCGEKYGIYREGIETYHLDKCDVCGETKEVCHVRRYNYLRERGKK